MEQMLNTSYGTIGLEKSSGTGMPRLLIHGNSSCKEVFKHQLQGDIGSTYQCIAMDLPGHGKSGMRSTQNKPTP
jgi:pimeloyl-ACP methyl ester carboxylesterase